MDFRALIIYTDGSAFNNPRVGGVGIRFIFPDFLEKKEFTKDFSFPGYRGATINQMELKACIIGLKEASKLEEIKEKKINRIIICKDSDYVVKNYPIAFFQWQKQKWRLKSGAPVLNTDLWKELIKAIIKLRVRFDIEKVEGHSKDMNNRAVDKLAKQSARNSQNLISETNIVRRKITKEKTQVGCVRMTSQKIKIRIISSRYLKKHKEFQLRYEVISKRNLFYEKVDLIFSKYTLRPGHKYLVLFNCDNKYPQINRLIKEIE